MTISRALSPTTVTLILMGAVAIAVPFFTASYGIYVASLMLINVLIAVSYNFLIGYTQQFSLGHVALYAIGAYGTAAGVVHLGLPYVLAIPFGATLACLGGVLVALPALRLKIFYLAISTLALTMLVHWGLMHGGALTGGGSGLRVGRADFAAIGLSADQGAFYLILAAVTVIILIAYRIMASHVGRRMLCIGEREVIAGALGIPVYHTKVKVFAVSGLLVGLAGGFAVLLLGFADPETFFIINVILFFMFVIVGGRKFILGSVVGAVFLTGMWEYLRLLQGLHEIGLGLLLLAFMMFMPVGIVGALAAKFPAWREMRHAAGIAERTDAGRTTEVIERARARHKALDSDGQSTVARIPAAAGHNDTGVPDGHSSVSEPPVVELLGVSKRFGGVVALNNIELSFSPGQIHGIIGPNGSGKSTLINIMSGVVKPDSGSLRLFDENVTGQTPSLMARKGIVRSFQDTKLVPSLTVLENVMLGSDKWRTAGAVAVAVGTKTFRHEERQAISDARWALDFVSMSEFENRLGNQLSGGQMRLVEIARAVASQSPLILLDEPAAGLSLNRIDSLRNLILRLKNELGVTVILVEHVLNLVFEASDDVTVLAAGEVIFRGTPEQARDDEQVRSAYLGSHR